MNKILDYGKFLKMNESAPFQQNSDLIGKIDYTLLTPSATEEQILELCEKATNLGVKSVCVLPKMVSVAAEALKDSSVLVCTVISFPHGTDTTEQKLAETKKAIVDGADECDMVLDYPLLKTIRENEDEEYEEKFELLQTDVKILSDECHKNGKILKVIVESGELSAEETDIATYICLYGDADFIKTSTGYAQNGKGAELDKVQIMRNIITEEGSDMKIKASGAIRTMADIQKFAPYVDRFGIGFAAVDSIFGGQEKKSEFNY